MKGQETTISSEEQMRPHEYMTADDVIKYFGPAPETFIGVSTSDFQIQPIVYDSDGNLTNVSDWELHVMKEVRAGRERPEDFPRFYDHMEQYVKRAEDLGLNMFRLSLDFARLCPEPDTFNEGLMAQYVKALALIKSHGMEPMLCIYHWPMPNYLLDVDSKGKVRAGGWEHPEVQTHFRNYVEKVVKYLSDERKICAVLTEVGFNKESQDNIIDEGLVQYFLTINEPVSILSSGYLFGTFPPNNKADFSAMKTALSQLVIAHGTALKQLKSLEKTQTRSPQVGVSHGWTLWEGPLGSGKKMDEIANLLPSCLMEDAGKADFLGMQYYSEMRLPFIRGKSGERLYGDNPDFGNIYPPGMYQVLKDMNNQFQGKSIIVTEFGFAENYNDLLRPYLILETARYAMQAKQEGLPIDGMLLWTLVHNYEWAHGMGVKFGLFNESQLSTPLIPSQGDSIRSWEVWQAIAGVLRSPQDEETLKRNLQELQRVYRKAEEQFQRTLEKQSKR